MLQSDMNKIVQQLQELNGVVSSTIISDLIKDNATRADRAHEMYDEYKGLVPILDRKNVTRATDEVCNTLPADFRGDIIDTMNGYMFGHAVVYSIDGENETQINTLRDFRERNNIEDLDATTGKLSTICGYGARLCYVDTDGKARVMSVYPWECIFIYDRSLDDVQYAMRYYTIDVQSNGIWTKKTRVEWYDSTNVTYYIGTGDQYGLDTTEPINPQAHLFDMVPLIPFRNNDEEQGDFEKVKELIDAYDRAVSFNQDELEALRNAYLKIVGATLPDTPEEIARIREARSISVPEGGDISYLEKHIDDAFNEHHLDRLEENIYRFSKVPNMSDEQFSGASQSGESRKWKLLGLENKAVIHERKFVAGCRRMFKVLASAWKRTGVTIDPYSITYEFTRNLPAELATEAEFIAKLKGMISDKTLFSNVSFIEDPEQEIKQIAEDAAATVDLDTVNTDTDTTGDDNNAA